MQPTIDEPTDWRCDRPIRRVLRDMVDDIDHAVRRADEATSRDLERIIRRRDAGLGTWPSVDRSRLDDPSAAAAARAAVRRRGCLVVRNTFPRAQAEAWADRIRAEEAQFAAHDAERDGPIRPVYWSTPQVEARSHPSMLEVHHFLASCWTTHLEVTREPLAYPDRIRHLPAAVAWGGLGAHVDAAAERTWSTVAHVLTYADVYGGDVLRHDPWSAGPRLGMKARRPSPLRNGFRAFLGWTALTGFDGGGGCVHVVPAPAAIARVLLRPLQDDLVDDPPSTGPSLRIVEEHHPLLSAALTSIPAIEPGDTVWWHPDLIHAVPPTTGTGRDQILMYIPFAPRCPANDARLDDHRRSFLTGTHPMDFAPARSAQHLTPQDDEHSSSDSDCPRLPHIARAHSRRM